MYSHSTLVARMNAARSPAPGPRSIAPSQAVARSPANPHAAEGRRHSRASGPPARSKTITAPRCASGGFSKNGSPFRRGTTQSREACISRAIAASRGSSPPHSPCRCPAKERTARAGTAQSSVTPADLFIVQALRIVPPPF